MNKQRKVQHPQSAHKLRLKSKPTESVIIYLLARNEFEQSNGKRATATFWTTHARWCRLFFGLSEKKQHPKCFSSFFFSGVSLWCSTLNFPQSQLNENKYLFSPSSLSFNDPLFCRCHFAARFDQTFYYAIIKMHDDACRNHIKWMTLIFLDISIVIMSL